jgi:hypothetical protein
MSALRFGTLVGLCLILGAPATIHADNVGALTLQQLAEARQGTFKYHDPEQALADGFVPIGFIPGHGIEFLNIGRVDCNFDPAEPETLRYVESGNGLRLVGVEYAVPMACTGVTTPPEGFAGDADEWEQEPGVPVWVLGVWLWTGNPGGVFGEREVDGH